VIFDRIDDQFSSILQRILLGTIACDRGDLHGAARLFRHARRDARRIEDLQLQELGAIGQARAQLLAGRLRHAGTLLGHARGLLDRQYVATAMMRATVATAELHLRRAVAEPSALAHAEAAAQEARRQAVREGRRREQGVACRLLGECALADGALADAAAHLHAALSLFTEMGAMVEAARTRLALAEARIAGGGTVSICAEARSLLAEAQAQLAASGAALDLARAERLAANWNIP
jgi:hypothetical protein